MKKRNPAAFTLVELLVVIGIIALLISILLPALNKARGAANSIKCSANLRSMGQAFQMYASANKGFLPGSGYTTGRWFFNTVGAAWSTLPSPTGNIPYGNTIHAFDWMGPILQTMGVNAPADVQASTSEAVRYNWYCSRNEFHCPTLEGVPSTCYSGLNAGVQPATSYTAAVMFLLTSGDVPGYGSLSRITPSQVNFPQTPSGYVPNIAKIRNSGGKVLIGCTAKYANAANGSVAPTYDLSCLSTYSTTYGYNTNWADFGGYTQITSAYDRGLNPANSSIAGTRTVDLRGLQMRHGGTKGNFKTNVVFYDGHVDSLGEPEIGLPSYWMPTGSKWTSTGPGSNVFAKMWPDTVARYNITNPGAAQ